MLALLLGAVAPPVGAQTPDTTAAPLPQSIVPIPRADTVAAPMLLPPRPPISPRRAFVQSLFIPGYGQASLDRTISAGVFGALEVLAVGMARKSAADVREARRAPVDSTVLTYRRDPATGQLVLDPETGQPVPESFAVNDVSGRLRARKTHLEDWIAILIFNHLFAAADAYVAAHLWDFPVRVGASASPERGARVSASVIW